MTLPGDVAGVGFGAKSVRGGQQEVRCVRLERTNHKLQDWFGDSALKQKIREQFGAPQGMHGAKLEKSTRFRC